MGENMGIIDDIKERFSKRIPADIKARRRLIQEEKEQERAGTVKRQEKIGELLEKEKLTTEELRKMERWTSDVEKRRRLKQKEIERKFRRAGRGIGGAGHGLGRVLRGGRRTYVKTSKWYKTRYKGSGKYRAPEEFRGQRAVPAMERPEPKFHVGGVQPSGESIAVMGVGRGFDMDFKQPLDDKERGGIGLGGREGLLDLKTKNRISFMGENEKKREKKKEIDWY